MEKLEINELRNEIKEQLHIDIEKYKNEDVLLKFTELLLFPNYIKITNMSCNYCSYRIYNRVFYS